MKQPMTGTAGQFSAIEQADSPQAASPKLRVAAYIRVSTTLDIQENSFEVQERYYTDLIRSNPDWRMAGIYADEDEPYPEQISGKNLIQKYIIQ